MAAHGAVAALLVLVGVALSHSIRSAELPTWSTKAVAHQQSAALKSLLKSKDKAALQLIWDDWKGIHGKASASSAKDTARFAAFKRNLAHIVALNANLSAQGAIWWAAPNRFSDLLPAQFRATHTGMDPSRAVRPSAVTAAAARHGQQASVAGGGRRLQQGTPPVRMSWLAAGMTTSVKDQGGCGACWAYVTAAAFESKYLIQANLSLDLSEQQMISCDTVDDGCIGGWPTDSFAYAYNSGGLTTDADYPEASNVPPFANGACQTLLIQSPLYGAAQAPGYVEVYGYSYSSSGFGLTAKSDLMNIVATQGPAVIAWYVDDYGNFQSYGGGIITQNQMGCAQDTINHAMLVVGYDSAPTDGSKPYWIVKNSWGTSWGESGYARVEMLDDGTPGTCAMYYYSFWYPTAVTVPSPPSPLPAPSPLSRPSSSTHISPAPQQQSSSSPSPAMPVYRTVKRLVPCRKGMPRCHRVCKVVKRKLAGKVKAMRVCSYKRAVLVRVRIAGRRLTSAADEQPI